MRLFLRFLLALLALTACQRARPVVESSVSSITQSSPPTDVVLSVGQSDSLFQRAERFRIRNENDSAIFYYKMVESLYRNHPDTMGQIMLFKTQGEMAIDKDEFVAADGYFENARRLAEKINTSPDLVISIYLALAYSKIQTTDYTTAQSMVQYALKLIRENMKTRDAKLMGRCSAISGMIFFYNKEYSKAIDQWNETIAIYKSAGMDVDKYYSDQAQAYTSLKDYASALSNLNKAIAIVVRRDGPDSKKASDLNLLKGGCFKNLGNLDSAEFYFRKTAAIRHFIFKNKSVYTFGADFTLGLFFERTGQLDSAIKYVQKSMISLVRNFENSDEKFNPVPDASACTTNLFVALDGKARLLKLISDRSPLDSVRLNLSLMTYLLADSVLNVYRRNAMYDDSQMALKERYKIPYESVMGIVHTLYQQTHSPKYLNFALEVMESSRAALLQDALQRAEAFGLTKLPRDLRQRENELIRKREELLARLERNQSQQAIDSVRSELLTVNIESQNLKEEIGRISPNYSRVKYENNISSVARLKDQLIDEESVYVEFFWGVQSIYALMITSDGIQLKQIPKDSAFNTAYKTFLSELDIQSDDLTTRTHFVNYCKSGHFLYRQLLGEEMDGRNTKKLLISADGQFSSFPFDALLTHLPDTIDVDYRLPYLVRQCAVGYVYSSGLMSHYARDRNRGNRLMAFGYGGEGPTAERNEDNNLPGTNEEIWAIKSVMNNTRNRFYMGLEASEGHFKNEIRDFNIAHLAIHGVADTVNALQSRLIFRSENDSLEDGKLYAHELYDLNLEQLDLAVLSACESGIGKQQSGEGMMSMARGFAYAGCPSLVISLWRIDDRMAARVMGSFYNYLSQGERIDESLAHAKLEYLAGANEFNAHPRFWAAFMQVGDTRAIQKEKPWMNWFLITSAAILSIGIFLYKLRKTTV